MRTYLSVVAVKNSCTTAWTLRNRLEK